MVSDDFHLSGSAALQSHVSKSQRQRLSVKFEPSSPERSKGKLSDNKSEAVVRLLSSRLFDQVDAFKSISSCG